MKQCSNKNHHALLDESEFHKNRSTSDGLHNWCKTCVNEARREKYNEGKEMYLILLARKNKRLQLANN